MFLGDDFQKFRMKNVNLQTSPFEQDLGVIISEDLSWVEQTKTRCNKAYRAFFNLKSNTSPLSLLCLRLKINCGYVVPILTHCSPVWHADRTSKKELELVQKRVTEWIGRTSQVDVKTRLIQLKLLPINLYIEMHHLLTCKIVADQYNFDWTRHITPIEKSSLRTTTSSPFYLPKIRRSKSKDNFWYRTLQFHRRLSRTVILQELCHVKEGIQDYYWKFFINNFCEKNLSSWRIIRQCQTCSP